MSEEKVEASTIPAGIVPEPANKPWDCQTLVVDGILGVAINQHQVRIGLVEHHPGPEKVVARHVANIVMQVDQFEKFLGSLNTIHDQLKASRKGAE